MSRKFSRRDLGFLLPAMAAANAAAQQPAAPSGPVETISSQVFSSEKIPYTGDDKKKGRRFFFQKTHGGFKIEAHETILGPGIVTHEPHTHVHEEMIIIISGTLEANIEGKILTAPAGSILTFGSNKTHNARNVGTVPCRYYVVELRGDEA